MSARKVVCLISVVIIVVLLKFFFGKKGTSEKVYIENIGANVPSLNPHNMGDFASFRVAEDIYEGLLRNDQKGGLVLTGATKYEISEDKKTYTFYLREDSKWTNGDPVTAEDYVYAYRRAVKYGKCYVELLRTIKNGELIGSGDLDPSKLGVKSDGKYKLIIELDKPNFEFLYYLTLPIFLPVHKGNFDDPNGFGFTKPNQIISNGPYRVKNLINNDRVELEASDNYWDKKNVNIKKATLLMITDATTELNTFRAGKLYMTYHTVFSIDPKDYYKEFGNQFRMYDNLVQDKLTFNMKNSKFSDIRVRKALSIALDREKYLEIVKSQGSPSYMIIPENIYDNKFKNDINELQPFKWVKLSMKERNEIARKLLEEAGYSEKNKLKIEIYMYLTENSKKALETIKDIYENTFKGIVECTLRFNDWATFIDNVNKGEFEICNLGWAADYNLPSNFSMLYTTGNTGNHGFYSNKLYDEIYSSSLSAGADEYEAAQHLLNGIASSEYVTVPISINKSLKLVSNKIVGFNHEGNLLSKWCTKDLKFAE